LLELKNSGVCRVLLLWNAGLENISCREQKNGVAIGDRSHWKFFSVLLFLQNHGNTTTINETAFSDTLNIWTMQRENLYLLFFGKRFFKVITLIFKLLE